MTQFLGLMDMFDGGGAGAVGNQFAGGPMSGLLNEIGVRPMGYRDRMRGMQETRPMARPGTPGPQQGAPSAPPQQPPEMPQMQYGPQNGRGAAGPDPVGRSGPAPQQPTEAQRMEYGPQQPMQYGGRGQTGMPLPPGLDLSPEEMEIVDYLRSRQMYPY